MHIGCIPDQYTDNGVATGSQKNGQNPSLSQALPLRVDGSAICTRGSIPDPAAREPVRE